MALALGKIVKADPENWLISDDKLYVFGSPAPKGPELFQKDLAGNITKANQNRSILPKDFELARGRLFRQQAGLAQAIAQVIEIACA